MNCESARRALLEADPRALSATGGDELSDHVRTCAKCVRVAAVLSDGQAELARHLEGAMVAPPATMVGEVLQRSRTAETERRVLTLRRRAFASLLAAAAVAALLLWPRDRPTSPVAITVSAEASLPVPPRIEAPAGKSVAVIQTKNPSITVVWLFAGGD